MSPLMRDHAASVTGKTYGTNGECDNVRERVRLLHLNKRTKQLKIHWLNLINPQGVILSWRRLSTTCWSGSAASACSRLPSASPSRPSSSKVTQIFRFSAGYIKNPLATQKTRKLRRRPVLHTDDPVVLFNHIKMLPFSKAVSLGEENKRNKLKRNEEINYYLVPGFWIMVSFFLFPHSLQLA